MDKAQEKLIKSLHAKKGRDASGLTLVEGRKAVEAAGGAVEFEFTRKEWRGFDRLVTTKSPQNVAAVARIPKWSTEDIKKRPTVLILDRVQDPGNVGAIMRLALGFNASLVLVESADAASPKVIRASAGAMFRVPWTNVKPDDAQTFINDLGRKAYRLERAKGSIEVTSESMNGLGKEVVIVLGSEGSGIKLDIGADSLSIPHEASLESLNVANAAAILLAQRYQSLG